MIRESINGDISDEEFERIIKPFNDNYFICGDAFPSVVTLLLIVKMLYVRKLALSK